MLYQSTSVGFGYGLWRRRCFPEVPRRPPNPIRENDLRPSSRSGRLGNINPIPIGYGFRPRLRGPANPARINLAQEPLDFRREGFSPSFTLLMSAFALPMPPARSRPLHRPTERSATASEDRDQRSRTCCVETLSIGRSPYSPPSPPHLLDVAEIAAVEQSTPASRRRADRHHQKRRNSGRVAAGEALSEIGADRFDARRIWSASAHCSIRGNSRLD